VGSAGISILESKSMKSFTLQKYSSADFSIDIDFFPDCRETGDQHKYTVLIGPNGTGKSRALADICATFLPIANSGLTRKRLGFSDDGIVNYVNETGQHIVTKSTEDAGLAVDVAHYPRRIIAATATPFDKFPRPDLVRPGFNADAYSIYKYSGLKDFRRFGLPALRSPGQAFAEAILTSAWNGSLEKFNQVLHRLGFDSDVKLEILSRPKSYDQFVREMNNDERFSRRLAKYQLSKFGEARLRDVFELLDRLPWLTSTAGASRHNRMSLSISELTRIFNNNDLSLLIDLLQLDLITPTNVSLYKSKQWFPYNRISSGELSLLTVFSGIAVNICDGSLVIVDEPEISLHPERQLEYVSLLVLASHSPLILASLPGDRSYVTSINRNQPLVLGESSDYFLAEAFKVPGPKNRYLLQETYRAMSLASKGDGHALNAVLQRLKPHYLRMDDTDPTKQLLKSLYEIKSGQK
jgi:predicted ATPase